MVYCYKVLWGDVYTRVVCYPYLLSKKKPSLYYAWFCDKMLEKERDFVGNGDLRGEQLWV